MFSYRWTYRFAIPPLEAVLDAVEAYFTTLAPARYRMERRERFCIEFRRGAWRGRLLDSSSLVPRFSGIDRRDVATWPTFLTVTALPSPTSFEIMVQRDVQLPNGLPLTEAHRALGEAAFAAETNGLVDYLAEFFKLPHRPDVADASKRT
ncbi:MAG: hypothetical protein ACPMAQ_04960 [Phycisphaerae bacterium]